MVTSSIIALALKVKASSPGTRSARRPRVPAIVSGVVLALASLNSLPGATTNISVIGSFPNYSYNPKAVSIQVGDTIIWGPLSGIHSVTGTDAETMCGVTLPANCTTTFNVAGSYRYHCINHASMTGLVTVAAVALPPAVAITNPLASAVFAAPASVLLSATATSSGGLVTNVQFFGNGSSLGTVTSPPFSLTTAPLTAGNYALTAKAIATTGLAATSSPVNISIVSPVAVSNYAPRVLNGQFIFNHTANPGLRYRVERTASLPTNWSPVITNTAASNSVEVLDTFQAGDLRFYRVGRLPNP